MRPLSIFLALLLVACDRIPDAQERPLASHATTTATAAGDGVTPMPYLLRRFQARMGEAPATLRGGEASLDGLVARFTTALAESDTATLVQLRVTGVEFAHLYFPESIFMRPPYELDPEILWMQVDAASSTGLRRALEQYGGRPAGYAGLLCGPPDAQGATRIHGCDIRVAVAAGGTARQRLFGAILERNGRFKFLSFQNRL